MPDIKIYIFGRNAWRDWSNTVLLAVKCLRGLSKQPNVEDAKWHILALLDLALLKILTDPLLHMNYLGGHRCVVSFLLFMQ